MTTKHVGSDFLVLISLFHNMVRCTTNTVVMYVKRGFSNCLLFVKTHHYGDKQQIDGKVDHNILVMKNELVYNQADINLDIAQEEHEI